MRRQDWLAHIVAAEWGDHRRWRGKGGARDADLTRVLKALVGAMIAYRRFTAGQHHPRTVEDCVFSFTDPARREPLPFDAVTGDPVHDALQRGIRSIGREMHTRGGMAALTTADVEILKSHGLYGESIVDRAFHGIGDWWC